ncbi:LysR family transcriptional regulator [Microbaculum sp. FT89]|uniref:LysR family transcriptional regulator n=1 Tax=Microbaculum sp. FT89 TaxID=3447298 RepID=UPI003F53DE89
MLRTQNFGQSDLRLLRVFMTVVESGGFTPAQIMMNIGQSTISAHMAALEERLNMRLCERGRGGFRVTPEGREVYEAAQRLFRSIDSFSSEVNALCGRLSGEIQIGMVDSIVTNPCFPLSAAVARFEERQGDVKIYLHIAAPAKIERNVFEGRFDLGIGGYTQQLSGIDYVRLVNERQSLYCGRGHPLFDVRPDKVRLEDIVECRLVKRPYVPDELLPEIGSMQPAALTEFMEAVAFLVLSGDYIGYLPEHFARQWVESGRLRPLMSERLRFNSTLELISRKSDRQSLAVRHFRNDLIQVFSETPDTLVAQPASPTSRRRN